MKGNIKEVFASFQGEGLLLGEPTLFIRLAECNLKCPWCDTDYSKESVFSIDIDSFHINLSNPVDPAYLLEILSQNKKAGYRLAVTGGEPLLQSDFLLALLGGFDMPSMLETNGTLPDALEKTVKIWDFISMDIKLEPEDNFEKRMQVHSDFLDICRRNNIKTQIKIVLHYQILEKSFMRALKIVEKTDYPLIIQPVTGVDGTVSSQDLKASVNYCKKALEIRGNIRFIPQVHRLINIK